MNLKIVSWNCHYGLTDEKVDKLLEKNDFVDADIYAIQECEEKNISASIESKLGSIQDNWYGDHKEYEWYHNGDLGIALFSNKYQIERVNKNKEPYRYVIPYKVTDKKTSESFNLIHIWTKTKDREQNYKEDYFMFVLNAIADAEYSKYLFPNDGKVIWAGDFNWSAQLKSNFAKSKFSEFELKIKNKLESAYHMHTGIKLGEESVRTFFDKKSNSFFNDYIFYGTNGFNINNAVIGSRDGWNLSECRKEFLSDHCPIMAELSLK